MIIIASGWRKWLLDRIDASGIALPWDTIWIHPDFDTPILRRHEETHLLQMQRDGKIVFLIKYYWWWITRGYENIPYEIEACEREME